MCSEKKRKEKEKHKQQDLFPGAAVIRGVVSVIMTFTAAAGRGPYVLLCGTISHFQFCVVYPVFFFSHIFAHQSLPSVSSLIYSSDVSAAWHPSVIHL